MDKAEAAVGKVGLVQLAVVDGEIVGSAAVFGGFGAEFHTDGIPAEAPEMMQKAAGGAADVQYAFGFREAGGDGIEEGDIGETAHHQFKKILLILDFVSEVLRIVA